MKRSSNSRVKGLQVTNSTKNLNFKIRQNIDQMIYRDYQEIKILSDGNLKNINSQSIFSCGTCSNNPLIVDYIKTIYQQYGIPDPMNNNPQKIQPNTRLRISNLQQSQVKDKSSLNQSKNQITILGKSSASKYNQKQDFLNSSKKNYIYFYDQNLTNSKNQTKFQFQTPRKQQSTFLNTSIDHPQTFNSKYFLTGQNSMNLASDGKNFKNSKIQNFGHLKTFSVQQQMSKTLFKIKDSYRYCIVCEQPILQINLQSHQIQCKKFQQLYQMNLQQILQYLSKKIQKVRNQLIKNRKQIHNQDPVRLGKSIDDVLDKSLVVLKSGQNNTELNQSYNEAMNISNKWGKIAQQTNKLKWFLRIREHIKTHFML